MRLRFDQDTKELAASLSAAVQVGHDLWVGGDEGTSIACLRPDGAGTYQIASKLDLADVLHLPVAPEGGEAPEIDLEGMDFVEGCLWVLGSHSLKRKKPKKNDTVEKALKRLAGVEADGNRCLLARVPLTVDQTGNSSLGTAGAAQLEASSFKSKLLESLAADDHFKRFLPTLESAAESEERNIPGKDNGVDIEGLAVEEGGRVFAGLRGPVLRGWACIVELRVSVDTETNEAGPERLKLASVLSDGGLYRKHFLALDGLGIRDLCWDGDDLLILAGPTMAIGWPPTVYRWHGARRLPPGSHTRTEQQAQILTRIGLGNYLPARPGQTMRRASPTSPARAPRKEASSSSTTAPRKSGSFPTGTCSRISTPRRHRMRERSGSGNSRSAASMKSFGWPPWRPRRLATFTLAALSICAISSTKAWPRCMRTNAWGRRIPPAPPLDCVTWCSPSGSRQCCLGIRTGSARIHSKP
jgi:hypothetical protein